MDTQTSPLPRANSRPDLIGIWEALFFYPSEKKWLQAMVPILKWFLVFILFPGGAPWSFTGFFLTVNVHCVCLAWAAQIGCIYLTNSRGCALGSSGGIKEKVFTFCHLGLPMLLYGLSIPTLLLLPPFPLFFLSAPFLGVGILYSTMQIHLGSLQVCSWGVLLGCSAGAARDGFLGVFHKFPWLPQCPSCTWSNSWRATQHGLRRYLGFSSWCF